MNRSEITTAVNKVIAYKGCGKHDKAIPWARELIRLLDCPEILNTDSTSPLNDGNPNK